MFWIFLTMIAGFALELVLCRRTSSTLVKLIPLFLDLAVMLALAMLFVGKYFPGTYWGYTGEILLAAGFCWAALVLAAILLALVTNWAINYIQEKKMMEE